jgi:hypothetical protein
MNPQETGPSDVLASKAIGWGKAKPFGGHLRIQYMVVHG